jgi:hypothetical protein
MKANHLIHYAGWSAYVNVAANIIGFVSLFVFFAVGGPAGIINDSSSIFFSLSLIPLALMWHSLHRSLFPALSLVVAILGILAMLAAAILQALLVLSVVEKDFRLTGLLIYSFAPARRQRFRSPGIARAVRAMIGVDPKRAFPRKCTIASIPFMAGI